MRQATGHRPQSQGRSLETENRLEQPESGKRRAHHGGRQGHRLRALMHFFLLLTFCLAPSAALRAQADDPTTDFATANGLKVIHRRTLGNDVVAVRIYFKGGSRNITAKNAGIETLLLEVAQSGTKNFTKSQINRELARMGTIIDSGGSYDYSVLAMQCVRQHFDRSWQLLADIALHPLFEEQEVALARDQLVNALRQEADDPDSYVSTLSDRLLYAAHPYINRPSGTVESVSSLKAADLKAYHAAHLMTSRMMIVAVGNVALDDLKRKTEASFGKLPAGDYKPGLPPSFKNDGGPEFQLSERPVPTNYVRGVFAAPSIGDKDYPAMTVAVNILSQQFFDEVRVKRNLSYAPYADLHAQGANSGFIYVTTPRPNDAIKVMFDEIERMQRDTIREKPLADIVNGFLTTFYLKLETNDAQAARLGEYELLGGGWPKALTWLDEVRKVTPADLQRVANTYLKNFRFAVIGDPSKFDRALFTSK
jgi:zinc protease